MGIQAVTGFGCGLGSEAGLALKKCKRVGFSRLMGTRMDAAIWSSMIEGSYSMPELGVNRSSSYEPLRVLVDHSDFCRWRSRDTR